MQRGLSEVRKRNLVIPLTPQTNRRMRHTLRIRAAMPMPLAGRDMHHIADLQLPWRLAFRAHEPRAHRHREDLSALVVVPVCACAGGEADVVGHAIFGGDWLIYSEHFSVLESSS